MLMQYDQAKTTEEKQGIVRKLFEETFGSFAHFERYTQPSNLQGSKLVQNEKAHPTRIDENKLSIETYLRDAPQTLRCWNKLNDHIVHRIPMKKLHTANLQIVKNFLSHNELFSFPGIVDLIVSYFERKKTE